MGQKVHPIGIRLGIVKKWSSTWYAGSDYAKTLCADLKVKQYLKNKLKAASVSYIQIERPAKNAIITLHTSRPGVIIGKSGRDVDALRATLVNMLGVPVQINIQEVRKPETDAQLIADGIAQQLEKRVMFRRAMKRAVTSAMRAGAKGIKVNVSGRLGGAEIARSEQYKEGRVPLHTLRANIDFGFAEAKTTYGIIGVKVWVFKGDKVEAKDRASAKKTKKVDS